MSFATQITRDVLIQQLAGRKSYRRFIDQPVSPEVVDQIIGEGTQAPTSCNHQMHHFICIYDQDTKDRLQKISGSNDHFRQAPVVVVIAFQKGWNHNKFAVVQSTAAVVYHMTLSAHLRGLASVWNAGIGNSAKIAELLDIPLSFEIIGVLCIGHGDETLLNAKPPRRPVQVVRSVGRFERPVDHIYPLKPAASYPYERIKNHISPFAEHDPKKWDLAQIASWRSFAVFAKSPTQGIFVSRQLGTEMPQEVATLGKISSDMDILEVMPFAGHYTTLLARELGQLDRLQLAELASSNLCFAEERVANELARHDLKLNGHVMEGLKLPFDDNSFDRVFAPQVLEAVPDWQSLWSEMLRVCRPGGIIGLTVRNRMSWFGLWFMRHGGRGQVTNFGPYLPQNIAPIRARVIADAGSVTEYGVSPRPSLIGQVSRSWLGLRTSRLWAAQVTVRK
jgi:nitroreductase